MAFPIALLGGAFKLGKGLVKKAAKAIGIGKKAPATEPAPGQSYYQPERTATGGTPLDTRAIDSLKADVSRTFERIEDRLRESGAASTAQAETQRAKTTQTVTLVAIGLVGLLAVGAIVFAVTRN